MAIRERIQFDAKDNTRAAMTSVQRGLRGVERGAASLMTGLFALGGAAGFGLAIRRSLEFADAIGKTADKVGVGVEALQELRFAARQNGVEQRALDIGLQRFTRRLGEAAVGQGELRDTLTQYGIAVRDANGNIRSTESVLRDYANAVQGAGSKQEQLRLAFKAFDSEGAALVNLLRQGEGALDDYAAKARDLGIVLDEDLVRNAEEANDKLRDLTDVLQVKFAAGVTSNAESIVKLADALIKLVSVGSSKIVEFGEALGYLAARTMGYSDSLDEEIIRLERAAELEEQSLFGSRKVAEGYRLRAQELRKLAAEMASTFTKPAAVAEAKGVTVTGPLPQTKAQAAAAFKELSAEMSAAFDAQEAMIDRRYEEGDQLIREREEQRRAAILEAATYAETLLTPEQVLLERQAKLAELANILPGFSQTEEFAAELNAIDDAWLALAENGKSALGEIDQFAIQAARNIQSTLAEFLFDPFEAGLDGMLKGFIDTMRRMAAEIASQAILRSLFGGFAGGGGFLGAVGDFVTGKRATGGPVSAGGTYLVGERGPELLQMGNASGNIVPNHAMGGSVVVNIDARESNDPARLLALVPVIQSQIEQSMTMKQRRGYL